MKTRIDEALLTRAIAELRARDAALAEVIAAHPRCPLGRYRGTGFEVLAGSIIGQQLSTAAATTIGKRVRALAGGRVSAPAIAALPHAALREAGLSEAKTRYLLGLAEAAASGALNFRRLAQQPDEAVIEALTAFTGVGEWTAQMFLMFGLGRPDVAAPGDLGLQRGLQRLHGLDGRPGPDEFLELMAPWQPWRSIASWYLWRLAE